MQNEFVQVEIADRIGVITLNRPEILNAIHGGLMAELQAAVPYLQNHPDVDVVILTGAGDRAFTAGFDTNYAPKLPREGMQRFLRSGYELAWAITPAAKPVIAAVNGHCFAMGAVLALACDVRVASRNARFQFTGAIYGLAFGTWQLPYLIGAGVAQEYLLTARLIDAADAAQSGLVNRLVESGQALPAARELAAIIAKNSPRGLELNKRFVRHPLSGEVAAAYDRELTANLEYFGSEPFKERLQVLLRDLGRS
jgi:enoyl-CoA hydratase